MSSASGADIEIIERSSSDLDTFGNLVLRPNAVCINGREILIPEDAEIRISPIDSHNAVTVTLTMFVASLSIRSDGPAT